MMQRSAVDGSRRRRGCHADRPWTGRGGAAAATRIVRRVTAATRADRPRPVTRPVRPSARTQVAAAALLKTPPVPGPRGSVSLRALDAAVARGLAAGEQSHRAVECDLEDAFANGAATWLSTPTVVFEVGFGPVEVSGERVLDFSEVKSDDDAPAVAGGGLVAIVCWPELRVRADDAFGEPDATKLFATSLPHAWAPLQSRLQIVCIIAPFMRI